MVSNIIGTIRFTLNDGSVSHQIGTNYANNNSFEFPQNRPIKTIKVRADINYVVHLQFCDT